MPDLETFMGSLGAEVIAAIQPALQRLEAEMTRRLDLIEATLIRDALIDANGELLLQFGDGETRSLGRVTAQDGRDGRDGADASPIDLSPLLARLDALTTLSVTGSLIDRSGELLLLRADGSSLNAGKVVGRDGIDGKDGEIGPAGLGFDDLDVTLAADGRTITITFEREDISEAFELELPLMIYRGVYEAGTEYRSGDAVTFGGSAWVANRPTTTRPGEGADWTLAVKRGRDGKDFAGPTLSAPKVVKTEAR